MLAPRAPAGATSHTSADRPNVRSRTLVTGATGFTGGHLARTLAARGHVVRALVRDAGPAAPLREAGIELAVGDLRDRAAVQDAVEGCEVVYHIAAIYRQAGLAASEYAEVNAKAVGTVIEAAAAAGASRVVHCSTVGVHGDVEDPPADEDAPLRPGDVYQETKVEGERIAREAGERAGIALTIASPTGIYGPGDRRLLKLFRGVARRRFVILGSGEIFYHLTHVDDLVEGFRLCGETPGAAGRTYILAGGEVTTLNELVALIGERPRSPRRGCIFPCGPCGSPGRCARRSAPRSGSSHRCTAVGSISSPRAARSTSRARGTSSGTHRRYR